MLSSVELLKKIVKKEMELGLYNEEVMGVPIWRLMRHSIRTQHLKSYSDFDNKTNKKTLDIKAILSGYFTSFIKILNLFCRKVKYDNLVFAFPRVIKLDEQWIDKFTDPIIDQSDLESDYIIFQHNQAGKHRHPRYHYENVIESDFLDYSAKFLSILLSPLFFIIYLGPIIRLYKKGNTFFELDFLFFLRSSFAVGEFLVKHFFFILIFKKVKPQQIFVVNRKIFAPEIAAAKKMGITVYEMQHGVTQTETVLYSGNYNSSIDPDYFLAFGEAWKGPQFGVPVERIINIGWAYKDFVKNETPNKLYGPKHILVISEPSITSQILSVISELGALFHDYYFHIRLHPQEGLTAQQEAHIEEMDNVCLDDTSIDSALAVSSYSYVIGRSSSVLYEALSMGKKVAKLTMHGLKPKILGNDKINGFSIVHNADDFKHFLNKEKEVSNVKDSIYSDFQKETFNHLLKKSKVQSN